jgi:hypothetical protein
MMLIFSQAELDRHRKQTGNAAPDRGVGDDRCWSCGCPRDHHYHGGIGPYLTPPVVSSCRCGSCNGWWYGPTCDRQHGEHRCARLAGHEGPCAWVTFSGT